VTKQEMSAINRSAETLPVSANYEQGSWLYVPDADEAEDTERRTRFPNVQALIERARALDVGIIRLDADGDEESDLPTFDW
jgi:hypothetical protein